MVVMGGKWMLCQPPKTYSFMAVIADAADLLWELKFSTTVLIDPNSSTSKFAGGSIPCRVSSSSC